MTDWSPWIGKTMVERDVLTPASLARLAALLDREPNGWREGVAPPLAHWCCFLPDDRQSHLDRDGHPRRGGFLPPIPLPRRMWAGSRIAFAAPLAVGAGIERRSTILAVTSRHGASGPLVFVTVERRVTADGAPTVIEEQDLVYRAPPDNAPIPAGTALPPAALAERVTPDPTLLFRFSALTFNAHRIHYDRDYARDVEGYGGLVVQGPLQALLLMHFFLGHEPEAQVTHFEFRGQRPLLDTEPFDLAMDRQANGATLSTRTLSGVPAMIAEVRTA